VSGLEPPWPDPLDRPAGTSWVTTPIVADADADFRLKSSLNRPVKPGRSAARRTARSISVGVARSTASICSPTVDASGSSVCATMLAAEDVDVTRRSSRSSTASCARSMYNNWSFASTLSSRWISCVLPVSVSNGGLNSRFTS
jgi:hypothetical protein